MGVAYGLLFPGDEKEPGETLTVLVAKERKTRMVMASVVPRKTTGKCISDRVVAFMQEVGCDKGDLIMKADQEPAMQNLVESVCQAMGNEGRRQMRSGRESKRSQR